MIKRKSAAQFPDFGVFFVDQEIRCTKSFKDFVDEYQSHSRFFFFVCRIVGAMDDNRVGAAKALLPGARDDDERRRLETSIGNPDVLLKELAKHSKIISQNLTNGIVNSFQRYFSSIIQHASLKRPAVLSSSQTIKVDDILRFSKHRDLVSFIVDRKINELGYGGLADMEKYFDDRMGVRMFGNNAERDMLRLFVEARNINVHNGGIVNEIFASRVGKVERFNYAVGKAFHIDLDDLSILSANAMKVAIGIDRAVGLKFKLRRRSLKAWQGRSNPTPKEA